MVAPQVLIGFGAAILIPYMNVFFKYRFDISDSLLGILFSLSSAMIGVGTVVGPRLAARLGGKVRAVAVTQFSSLVFLLVMGFAPMLWLSAVGYFDAYRLDEHGLAFVFRFLHGADTRAPAGFC